MRHPSPFPTSEQVARARDALRRIDPAEIEREIEKEAQRREAAREARTPRRSSYVTFRCFDCKSFVRSREAMCRRCGYEHGGVNHEAEPVT